MGSSYRKLKSILESNILLERRYLLREQAPTTGATTGNTTTTAQTQTTSTTTTTTQKQLTGTDIGKLPDCSGFNLPDGVTKETIGEYDIYTADNKGKESKCKKPIES